jgi:arylsulfatase A-like enzyme
MVENLDWNIGRLREAIEASPAFADNTLVVYTADHGEYMGAHGAIRRKENPHQESVRIPALFSWPGQVAAQPPRADLFSLVDLLPTTLGLLGLEIPPHVQGRDFSPALRGEPFQGPDAVLLEMSGNPRWNLDFLDWRAVVTREWSYAFYETGHESLYDLRQDPYETHNLVAERPEVRERMRRRLLELLDETREPYFHVLIEHGAPMQTPILDVSQYDPFLNGALAPHWDQIEKL